MTSLGLSRFFYETDCADYLWYFSNSSSFPFSRLFDGKKAILWFALCCSCWERFLALSDGNSCPTHWRILLRSVFLANSTPPGNIILFQLWHQLSLKKNTVYSLSRLVTYIHITSLLLMSPYWTCFFIFLSSFFNK